MQRLTKQEVRRRVEATMISVMSLIETGLEKRYQKNVFFSNIVFSLLHKESYFAI